MSRPNNSITASSKCWRPDAVSKSPCSLTLPGIPETEIGGSAVIARSASDGCCRDASRRARLIRAWQPVVPRYRQRLSETAESASATFADTVALDSFRTSATRRAAMSDALGVEASRLKGDRDMLRPPNNRGPSLYKKQADSIFACRYADQTALVRSWPSGG